jgi:hypothetical protein
VKFPKDAEAQENGRNIAVIRLLTRLFFIWFMKEKGLIPTELFDEGRLKNILKNFNPSDTSNGNYYKAILQNLFFATLNTPIEQRKFRREESYQGKNPDYMNHQYYRYHAYFNNPDENLKLFKDIPFLNGGLFECLDLPKDDPNNPTGREIRIDGYSDVPEKQAFVPNHLFFDTEKGILSVFKKYHFTIEENTPFDQQVSLDPEMLGKVFENLLATYNPETRETARKATGSFYTPREIVYYMVKESLKEYFKNKLHPYISDNLDNRLEQLFSYTDTSNPFNEEETLRLIEAIHQVKILDPAVGSGAFPMEAINQMVHLLSKLDPHNALWKKQQKQVIEQSTLDPSLKQKTLEHIENIFSHNELGYGRKLFLIQNCLYGVDIQPIAIHIAKLRFFLSLLVDEKINDKLPNKGIEPLPNLETKLIAANTLIALPKRNGGLQLPEIEAMEQRLFQLRQRYFEVSDQKEKEKIKNEDRRLRLQIQQQMKNGGFPSEFADAIAAADIYDTQASHPWFDPEWMLGVKDGFDIVIGNPPYIQLQKEGGKLAKLYEKQNFQTFIRTGDIYALFYEKGLQLLEPQGILCYITSNKWMRAGYGEKLRSFFTQYNPKLLIDLGPGVFESATVDTNILLVQNQKANTPQLRAITLKNEKELTIGQQLHQSGIILEKIGKDAWFIGSSAEQSLKEKIERMGKPLKDWDVKIYRGVLTGLNEAFIITTEKRNEILANCNDEDERRRTEAIIKPILRGRDIKRYYYEWAGLWVIFIPWHFPLHDDLSIQGASEKAEKEFKKQYLSVYNHLYEFKEPLSKRNKEETGIRYEWYALQRCAATYYPEFEKEKVVYSETIKIYFDGTKNYPRFSFTTAEFYLDKTTFFLSGNKQKYFLGLLNSKVVEYLLENGYCVKLGIGSRGLQKILIEKIPLPPITSSNQEVVTKIESLVDQILTAKKPASASSTSNPQADTSHLEREIDQLVYQLYELTEEEIWIVENKNQEEL